MLTTLWCGQHSKVDVEERVVPDRLYEVGRKERRAAVRAFRNVPWRDRQEALRRAMRGEMHPDPAVAAASVRWSRVLRRRVWWNKLSSWAPLTVGLPVVIAAGWWRLWPVPISVLGAIVMLAAYWYDHSLRRGARTVLKAARSHGWILE